MIHVLLNTNIIKTRGVGDMQLEDTLKTTAVASYDRTNHYLFFNLFCNNHPTNSIPSGINPLLNVRF